MTHQLKALGNMLFCAIGIYVCFFYWGVLQERLGTKPYIVEGQPKHFNSFWVLSGLGSFFAVLISALVLVLNRIFTGTRTRIIHWPWRSLMTVAITLTMGPQFGYMGMRRLAYPVVVTVKMCKMIPILVVGVFWHGQRYPLSKVLNVFAITGGVVGMVLLAEERHTHADRHSSIGGVMLVLVNLLLDGYSNSTQDAIARANKMSGLQSMMGTNTAVFMLTTAYLCGLELSAPYLPEGFAPPTELSESIHFFSSAPDAFWDMVKMCLLNACGQFFIFLAIGMFGSLTMTALTLTRKVGSVFISIYANDHELVVGQWLSLALVMAGVVVDAWMNIRGKPRTH